MTVECYAVRRLNPFGGVAQVLAVDNARAISPDGDRWEIQVLADAPSDCWGSLSEPRQSPRYFRFGIWSRDRGLRRVPLNPIMNLSAMLEAADALLSMLHEEGRRVPFPLTDNIELWQLDGAGRPLALMMSAIPGENLDSLSQRHWSAAPLHDRNLGRERREGEVPLADDMERLIRRESNGRQARWFIRDAVGTGAGAAVEVDDAAAEILDRNEFPALPVRRDWPAANDRKLVERWIRWAAPRLLCLPYLDESVRRELEALARSSALEVSSLWRLYPGTVNSEFVTTARVEAQLRAADDIA